MPTSKPVFGSSTPAILPAKSTPKHVNAPLADALCELRYAPICPAKCYGTVKIAVSSANLEDG